MSVDQRGPNVNATPSLIANDPLFNGLRTPIPASWYDANKRTYSLVDQDALYASLLYARFFGRIMVEAPGTPTDTMSVSGWKKVRYMPEVINVAVDTNVTVRHYVRAMTEVLPTLTDTGFVYKASNTLVNPVVGRWPGRARALTSDKLGR